MISFHHGKLQVWKISGSFMSTLKNLETIKQNILTERSRVIKHLEFLKIVINIKSLLRKSEFLKHVKEAQPHTNDF